MNSPLKIGVVVADIDEFLPFANFIKDNNIYETFSLFSREVIKFKLLETEVLVVCCGIGKVNAAVATTALIDNGCSCIFNYGLSGGISSVSKGEIVVPDSFLEYDFDLSPIGYKPCEKPAQNYIYNSDKLLVSAIKEVAGNCTGGLAVTGDRFVCNKQESDHLKNTFGALTCDMETAAIAYACYASNIPFASLRRVSDDADDNALDNYREMNSNSNLIPYEIILKAIEKIAKTN